MRAKVEELPEVSLIASEYFLSGGGVEGLRRLAVLMTVSRSRGALLMMGPGSNGVQEPDSPEGGVSVCIFTFSRSLSDSSLVLVPERIMVVASGLCCGRSGNEGARGTLRRLGRRTWSMKGLRSSAAYVVLVDAEDVDGGRAKSDEDVGNGGRDEGPSMMDYVGKPEVRSLVMVESSRGRYC